MQQKMPLFGLLLAALHFAALTLADGAQAQATKQAASEKPSTPQVVQPAELGNTKNVHRIGNLFVAGQFGPDDVERIKSEKFDRVVTLRTDGEIDWDEKAAIEAAGMQFIELPFRKPETLNDKVFDDIREMLRDRSSKTLLHCGSANRVGGVWLTYRVLDEKIPVEFAIQEAEAIGLRTEFIKEKALDYIKRQQHLNQKEIARNEESVKPGVNSSYLDPDLSVDEMVKRFEVESREIYSARYRIIPMTGIRPHETVADIGSGTGLFSLPFSDMVGSKGWIYAVDISPRLVAHVAKEAERRNLKNVTAVLCHEDHVNLPPESVDVFFICDTYHHFEYPKSTMKSIFQALKPGGRLILIDFERIPGQSRDWILGHVRAGKDVFRAEIQDAGLIFIEEVKIDGLKENYFLRFQKPK